MQINFFYEVTIYYYRSIFFSYLFLVLDLLGETQKAPAIFKEWNITERLISKKSSNWEIEKSALQDLLELLEEEKQTIEEKLNSVEKETSVPFFVVKEQLTTKCGLWLES